MFSDGFDRRGYSEDGLRRRRITFPEAALRNHWRFNSSLSIFRSSSDDSRPVRRMPMDRSSWRISRSLPALSGENGPLGADVMVASFVWCSAKAVVAIGPWGG